MSKQEILVTRIGEMLDMISCLSIYEGAALPRQEKKIYTNFDEAIQLR